MLIPEPIRGLPLSTKRRIAFGGAMLVICHRLVRQRESCTRLIAWVSEPETMKNLRSKEGAVAAELALKAHVLASNPEILAEMTEGDRMIQETADMVNLTEAPEDAVCSLVIDLLHYCEREKIDWTQEVMSRAREHLRRERAYEVQKR
jgi:hypothetical protein